jgi:hypothetical protein
LTGAYYASALTALRSEGRFTKLAPDPLIAYRAFWDIGLHAGRWTSDGLEAFLGITSFAGA